MTKIKVGMNLLEYLMEHEGGRKNIIKYACKIMEQEGIMEYKDILDKYNKMHEQEDKK